MKTTRRILALVTVLALILAMGTTAFAEDTPAGTITISGAVNGQTYTAYKVFNVTYNADKTSYNYSIDSTSAFYDTVSTFAAVSDNGITLTRVGSTATYNVVVDTQKFTAAKAAALASALNNDSTKPTVAGFDTAENDTATIDVSELGYYFVDSSLGSLCALDTTNKDVTVYEKNALPTLTKSVKDDDATEYGSSASADINQAVSFKLVVNTGTNAQTTESGVDANYVITDTLPAGMTYDALTSVKVDNADWAAANYSAVHASGVLTITLNAAAVQALGQNEDIEIIYTAKLNGNAVVASTGNTNEAILTYKGYTTNKVTATVYTYALAIEKYNSAGTNLADATFSFPFTATKVSEGTATTPVIYKVTDATTGTTEITTPASGNIVVVGLDIGDYVISETAAPAGYNKLTNSVTIPVEATSTDTVAKTFTTTTNKTVTFAVGDAANYQIAANSIVGIENLSGTELPSTGGMGTTIFYVLGGLMVLGALVVLVTNKRMRAN